MNYSEDWLLYTSMCISSKQSFFGPIDFAVKVFNFGCTVLRIEYVVLVSKVLVQHEFFLAAAAWSLIARPAAASSDPASRGFIIV